MRYLTESWTGTDAEWLLDNPIIKAGDEARVINSAGAYVGFKRGDGTKRYSELSLIAPGGEIVRDARYKKVEDAATVTLDYEVSPNLYIHANTVASLQLAKDINGAYTLPDGEDLRIRFINPLGRTLTLAGSDNIDEIGNILPELILTNSPSCTVLVNHAEDDNGKWVQWAVVGFSSGNGTNTAPVITLQGENPMSLPRGTAYVEPGYTIADAEDGNKTTGAAITGAVDTNTVGTYTLNYDYADSEGLNAATRTRTINVYEPEPIGEFPVITLLGANPYPMVVGEVYDEPGYTATDAEDGDVTADVVVDSSDVNNQVVGIGVIRYSITDTDNNVRTVTRTVEVSAAPTGVAPFTSAFTSNHTQTGMTDNWVS